MLISVGHRTLPGAPNQAPEDCVDHEIQSCATGEKKKKLLIL